MVLPTAGPAGRAVGIRGLQARDAELASQSREVVLGLYSLDARLAGAQLRLDRLRAREGRLRREQSSLASQLRIARGTARVSQQRLASRVRFIYDHGSTSALEVVLASKSIDEALTEIDSLDRLATMNAAVFHEAQSSKARLARISRVVAARSAALKGATEQAAETMSELASTRRARTAYLARLSRQRALTQAAIARLEAQAQAAAERSLRRSEAPAAQTAEPAETAPATPTTPALSWVRVRPVPVGRTLSVVATGYSLSGRTASGLPVGWGVAAVDPSVIPLGTHLAVPGYGEAVAADTGGAVAGATIDLWFPSRAQAAAWGRRTVTITLH
jgi:peptidoglycan DL-endopeptidase CwlO